MDLHVDVIMDRRKRGRRRTSTTGATSATTNSARPALANENNPENPVVVLEIDDETDEDLMAVLLDPPLMEGMTLINSQYPIGSDAIPMGLSHLFTQMKRIQLDPRRKDNRVNRVRMYAYHWNDAYTSYICMYGIWDNHMDVKYDFCAHYLNIYLYVIVKIASCSSGFRLVGTGTIGFLTHVVI